MDLIQTNWPAWLGLKKRIFKFLATPARTRVPSGYNIINNFSILLLQAKFECRDHQQIKVSLFGIIRFESKFSSLFFIIFSPILYSMNYLHYLFTNKLISIISIPYNYSSLCSSLALNFRLMQIKQE